jgi:hypothetical protein
MKHIVLLSLFLAPAIGSGQAPTWSADVACIAFSHCTSCHHPGGISGEALDLTSYDDAHAHRDDIRDYTSARVMPPWPPHAEYRSLAHERVLTQAEIDIIASWANAGGPSGDLGLAPPPPVYTTEWSIPVPDLSVKMSDFTIPTLSEDLYRAFVIPSGTTADKWIKEFEVIPGNNAAVHHVLVYQDTTGQAQALDDADPDPGYVSFGGIGVSDAKLVGVWVPGATSYSTPPGMGIKLFAGADIVIQVHYPDGSDGLLDSTRVNFEYDPGTFVRNLDISSPLEHLVSIVEPFLAIPPDQVATFHEEYQIPSIFPATVVAIGPHAHLLCKHMKSYAVTPAQDTVPLIDLDWDFHWQGMYEFRRPIYLPGGSWLYGEATYDNTSNNEDNPNDPPQWVTLGESTTDEMMLFFMAYTYGFPSDTNIVIDDSPHQAHYLDCNYSSTIGLAENVIGATVSITPSPASDLVNVNVDLDGTELRLIDIQGRELLRRRLTHGTNTLPVGHLARGSVLGEVRDRTGRVLYRSPLLLQ